MKSTVNRRLAMAAAVFFAALSLAPFAQASELTREEYTARVEPICRANTQANQQIFMGAKDEVKAGELKTASTRFSRAVSKAKAQTLSVRLNRNSNLANNTVLAFGFDYCKINPSRFS